MTQSVRSLCQLAHRTLTAAVAVTMPLQGQVPENAADSAAAARRSVNLGIGALRAGDTTSAHQQIVNATRLWPTQGAYLWTRAQLAPATGDTADAIAALTQFATLGHTRSLANDRLLAALAVDPRFAHVSGMLSANAAPMVRSTIRATLSDSTIFPEGVTFDGATQRFFIGSVRQRTILVHGAAGTRALWTATPPRVGAILGVQVDSDGAHLWATTSGLPQMLGYTPADSSIAALLRIRIADGAIVARFDLPPAADGHTLGDVAVGPAGDVFVSDSREPVLHRLRRGATALDAFRHPLFRSLQGIAPHPDGRHVYIADYSHGLLRLDLQSRDVTRLADAPSGMTLGIDGLQWYRGSLIGVQNGAAPMRIVRFHLDAAGTRIVRQQLIDRNVPLADEPTIGVIIGDAFVYIANSQWEKYDERGARVPGTVLSPPRLLAVPLRDR